MSKKMKKLLSLLLTLVIILPASSGMAAADTGSTEPLPTTLEAPGDVILYDTGYSTLDLDVKIRNPESLLDIYEKGYTSRYVEGSDYFSDYGGYYLYTSMLQIDWKIDDGDWQYTEAWDTSAYPSGGIYSTFNGSQVNSANVGYASQYGNSGVGSQLAELEYLKETTDGYSTYYRLDTENHKVSVRARYMLVFQGTEWSDKVTVLSGWSDAAVYGMGNTAVSTAPASLSAPVIANLELNDSDDYYGSPMAQFEVYPGADIGDALMWSEQYDEALEYNEIYLVAETSLDPNFGDGSVVHRRTFSESSSMRRLLEYDDMFYDLWYDLPESDQEAFTWNGETIYLRTKWVNEREVSNLDSSIESPYSNVLSLQGPITKSYTVTITHGDFGFDDDDGYYEQVETYKRTEGLRYYSVYCHPMEGCYVDTVTVNGSVMYDYDDETTHELLDWWGSYTSFEFIGEANVVTQNLNIEIIYGGTPTAKYGITTEWGTGGTLYCYSSYDSWNDNSLVVFHGAAPKIVIDPYDGYEIDTVLIDGVENTEAKEAGEYTFPAITDNTHSIEVTFKRVAYEVYSYVNYSSHGTLTTDYEGYDSYNDYVKIGDDITFTFAPLQDGDGNYYEIEEVYIDYVVNEEAKNAGTYTFTNVQADHTIGVYYSADPVITHDITVTSGENGEISPEGVIHAREGSVRTFYFYPDTGYEVDQVFVDGLEITNLATKEYYTIANITEEHTIHVTFKKTPVRYNINVIVSGDNPSVHTVNPRGETPVWEGESFTATWSPFAGYQVVQVLVDNTPVTADGTYSIASAAADHTIEIVFQVISYNVTFKDHDENILKTETVPHGNQATPPADPVREHYVFIGWDVDYSNVTTNVTIRAQYRPAEYTVTFLGWNGDVLKSETVEYGADATAPEVPAREGYEFSHWSHDFTAVSRNMETTAVYNLKEYTVNFVDSDDTPISTQTVGHGQAAVAPADPVKEGWTFVGWENTGYGHVTSNMTIKAMYVEGSQTVYSVTAAAHGTSGTVSPAGMTQVIEGGSLTIHFYPDAFSKIQKVEVDGSEITLCESYTFENITKNHTVDVYFVPTAQIHVNSDTVQNGTVSGGYDLLDNQTVYALTVTAADGYELDGIYINGQKAELELIGGRYIIRNLSDDMDIEVRFKSTQSGEEPGGGDGYDPWIPSTPSTPADPVTPEEPAVDETTELKAKIDALKLVARSEMSSAQDKKAVKVRWFDQNGADISFLEGFEVFRSVKRYEGYSKKPFFETEREKYWNTQIDDGMKYYYKVRGYVTIDGEKYYTDWSLKAWRTVK